MEEEKGLKAELKRIADKLDTLDTKGKKTKKFRVPRRAVPKKSEIIKGYATVLEIKENGAAGFRREKIEDNTIKLDDTFHSVDSSNNLNYAGKPFIIIAKTKKHGLNILENPNQGKNETYGQKYIKSRMLNEVISTAKKRIGGVGISIGALIIVAVIAYALIAG